MLFIRAGKPHMIVMVNTVDDEAPEAFDPHQTLWSQNRGAERFKQSGHRG